MKMDVEKGVVTFILTSLLLVCVLASSQARGVDLDDEARRSVLDRLVPTEPVAPGNPSERKSGQQDEKVIPVEPHEDLRQTQFIQTMLSDLGELETRISHNGVQAIEVSVPSRGEDFLFVREAMKGNRLVQIAYQDRNHIVECKITSEELDLVKFMEKFRTFRRDRKHHGSDNSQNGLKRQHSGYGNYTMRLLEDGDIIPDQYKPLLEFRALLQVCRSYQKQVRQLGKEAKREERLRLRNEKHHSEQTPAASDDTQQPVEETPNPQDSSLNTANNAKQSSVNPSSQSRYKRSMMIYPGTQWCGAGTNAKVYDELGDNTGTDRCCREHDHCPYVINRLSTSYSYWNYRFHTLSHCSCEARFRECLKSVKTEVANMVGYLYFNYVGTTCFNLKPSQVCQERSWLGYCSKYETQYLANILENPITY